MEIVWLIIIGAIVGFLGSLLAGRSINWALTIILGIVGNFIGFYVYRALGGGEELIGYLFGVIAAALLTVLVTGAGSRRRAL